MTSIRAQWKHYLVEFLTVFVGVTLAFLLTRWNEERRDANAELETLIEIRNGILRDEIDLAGNIQGHKNAVTACAVFMQWLNSDSVVPDSLGKEYHHLLRDFISIQNKSAYESLNAKGLDLVRNDSLRLAIVSLYDFSYEIIEKLEEDYEEMQYFRNYAHRFDRLLLPYMTLDTEGAIIAATAPKDLRANDKKLMLNALRRIKMNRTMLVAYYESVIAEITKLKQQLDSEIARLE